MWFVRFVSLLTALLALPSFVSGAKVFITDSTVPTINFPLIPPANPFPGRYEVGKPIDISIMYEISRLFDPLSFTNASFSLSGDVGEFSTPNIFYSLPGDCVGPYPFIFWFGGGGEFVRMQRLLTTYDTPGVKTLTVTAHQCDFFGGTAVIAQYTTRLTILPASQQKFRVVTQNLHTNASGQLVSDPASRQTLDLPPGVDRFNQPFSFNLGELFKLSVVPVNTDGTDGAALPIQTSFDSQITNPAPIRSELFAAPTVLFPRNVLIGFTSTPEQFFPIHSGTANLAISFTPSGTSSPRTVHLPVQINSAMPFTLGQAPNTFDNLIEGFADLRGIPPQILKAQIGQETAHRFRADTYRYEPLSKDFAEVSASANLRVDPRFAPWRLATFPDFVNRAPGGLPQGSSLGSDPAALQIRLRFKVFTAANGLPVENVIILPSQGIDYNSLPTRNILPQDPPVSMENILLANDSIQHWISSCNPSGCKLTTSFLTWFRLRSRSSLMRSLPPGLFTGQPVIAASYGVVQVVYTTAVNQLDFTDANSIGLSPSEIFRPDISVDLGTEYLASAEFVRRFGTNPAVSSLADLKAKFGRALQGYNGSPSPNTYAQPILDSSNSYFPVRP